MTLRMDTRMDTNRYQCFAKAEQSLHFKLNDNFKEILMINGYDNEILLSTIEESDLENIETFLQNDYHRLISTEEKNNIYGVYKLQPEQFKILRGTRKQITMIAEYYKKEHTAKFDRYTQTDLVEVCRNHSQKKKDTAIPINLHPDDENQLNMNDSAIEKSIILKNLKSWLRTKCHNKSGCNVDEKSIDSFQLDIQNLKGQLICNATCFCGHICKVQKLSKKVNCQPRWIYSNIHKHFLGKHITSTSSASDHNSNINQKRHNSNKSISDFFSVTPNTSSSTFQSSPHSISITNINQSPTSSKQNDDSFIEINETFEEEEQHNKEKSVSVCTVSPSVSGLVQSKWKSDTYQRNARTKRKRENVDNDQLLLTTFFPIIEKVLSVFNSHPELMKEVGTSIPFAESTNLTPENASAQVNGLLKKLCEISLANSKKFKQKHTYDDVIKKLGLYLYYVGGRLLYEVLYANLKDALPAISTLNRFVSDQNNHFDEGTFDFKNLKCFLYERNLPPIVWLSEDGTRITGKIEYNSRNNTLMGFSLPLKNGLPVRNAYLAKSAKLIQGYFQNCSKANYAYVIMAQPLSWNAPAFCLSIYSTDNTFTYKDVLQRWKYLEQEAERHGIRILGYSSDGDTRLLKSMRIRTQLPAPSRMQEKSSSWRWYNCPVQNENTEKLQTCIQDEIHIGTKLRNRLLKPNIILPIGNYFISVKHIQQLVESKSKDEHFLTLSDINPVDRMNFKSVEKISSPKVLQLLSEVSGSEGTAHYLKIIRYTLDSFLDKSLTLDDRIYHIWYAVFSLRLWRQWIKNNPSYKLKDNFVTGNAYLCVELNAHGLIKLIHTFRDNSIDSHLFCPWLFSSQSCEKIFRATRSMTTTMSTVVNFSIKDIISRIGRIKTVNAIIEDLKDTVEFPREKKSATNEELVINFNNFTNEHIETVVKTALNDVRRDMKNLGVEAESDSWNQISMKVMEEVEEDDFEADVDALFDCSEDASGDVDTRTNKNRNFIFEKEPDSLDVDSESEIQNSTNIGGSKLKDYSDKVEQVTEDCPYLKIDLDENRCVVIKKSSYCWLLEEEKGRVSSDRLRRFIGSKKRRKEEEEKSKTQKKFKKTKIIASETSSDSSEDDESEKISLHDDSSDADLESNEVDDFPAGESQLKKDLDLQIDQYYAVYYEEMWYIGRIIEENNNKYKLQFLKQDLNSFLWPKTTDIDVVEKKYLFYGPINLLGNEPFQICRQDHIKINRKYKMLKKDFM